MYIFKNIWVITTLKRIYLFSDYTSVNIVFSHFCNMHLGFFSNSDDNKEFVVKYHEILHTDSLSNENKEISVIENHFAKSLSSYVSEKQIKEDCKEIVNTLKNKSFKNLVDMFYENDKRSELRFEVTTNDESFTCKLYKTSPRSKNPFHLYINTDGIYLAKINPDGVLTFSKEFYNVTQQKFLLKQLDELNSDTKNKIISFGKTTKRCSCCGLPLTDPKSIELGVGPVCLENWGL